MASTALEQYVHSFPCANTRDSILSFARTRSLRASGESPSDQRIVHKLRHELAGLRSKQLEVVRDHDKQITELAQLHREREEVMWAQFTEQIQATPSTKEKEVTAQVQTDMEMIQENHKVRQRAVARITSVRLWEVSLERQKLRERFRLALTGAT